MGKHDFYSSLALLKIFFNELPQKNKDQFVPFCRKYTTHCKNAINTIKKFTDLDNSSLAIVINFFLIIEKADSEQIIFLKKNIQNYINAVDGITLSERIK